MEEKNVNPIDALFDEENSDNITLFNERDEEVEFEQIALIPLDENVYAILKPVKPIEGVADDEAFTFEIAEEDGEESLRLVEDDEIIDRVFAEYDKLVAEQDNK